MAMSINHRAESRHFGFEIKLIEIVQYINRNSTEFNDLRLRQLSRPDTLVDVSTNGGHRRDLRELLKNLGIADISSVNDPL